MSGPEHEEALNQLHEMFGAVDDGSESQGVVVDQWTRENLEMVLILQKSNLQQSIQCLLENGDEKPEAVIRKLLERDTTTANGLMPLDAPSERSTTGTGGDRRRSRSSTGEEEKSSIHERNSDARLANSSVRQSQASLLSRQSSATSNRSSTNANRYSYKKAGRNSRTPLPFDFIWVERSGLEAVNGQYFLIDPDIDMAKTNPKRHYFQYAMQADWEGDAYTFSLEKNKEDNCWYLCAKPTNNNSDDTNNTSNNTNGNADDANNFNDPDNNDNKINLFFSPEKRYRRTYRQYPRLRGWLPTEQLKDRGIRGIAAGTEIEPPKLRYD
ncbi:expressed unknown protein [Seminavis robusta]|uniref:Uncharacterized protein n=1 Tax=Seminavis robusta TaxID=568900 RepID=A0A9N8DC07_9STRA|nr:expressed unknown protein [Seminavis robusta]|eukprot:Sro53_g031460.1 n/a (326) ;mRNA; f:93193-94373